MARAKVKKPDKKETPPSAVDETKTEDDTTATATADSPANDTTEEGTESVTEDDVVEEAEVEDGETSTETSDDVRDTSKPNNVEPSNDGDDSGSPTRVDSRGGGDLGSYSNFLPEFVTRVEEDEEIGADSASAKLADANQANVRTADGHSANTDEDREHISYREAGRILGRAPNTIRRWVLEGLIKSKKEPTGRRRVLRSDLQQFIDASTLEGDVMNPPKDD